MNVYERMPLTSLVLWNVMSDAYFQCGLFENALKLSWVIVIGFIILRMECVLPWTFGDFFVVDQLIKLYGCIKNKWKYNPLICQGEPFQNS